MKQKKLLEQDKRLFRTADLAVLWQITNKNTLLTTIKRYRQNRILYRVAQGVYSTIPLTRLNPFELGCAVAGPLAYISLESVLSQEGIINQQPNKITLIGKKNQEFEAGGHTFLCRYVNPTYLVNRDGIEDNGRQAVATTKRAVRDMLYLKPQYHFDRPIPKGWL
ncbi:hypothetical protein A2W24_04475 [Microgenomates group bacterium RBG_16_45_19]|nr:MAG: hypothetical protein A2W24_04475 [Microgenomates group bacterium RBG_16_45_19]